MSYEQRVTEPFFPLLYYVLMLLSSNFFGRVMIMTDSLLLLNPRSKSKLLWIDTSDDCPVNTPTSSLSPDRKIQVDIFFREHRPLFPVVH